MTKDAEPVDNTAEPEADSNAAADQGQDTTASADDIDVSLTADDNPDTAPKSPYEPGGERPDWLDKTLWDDEAKDIRKDAVLEALEQEKARAKGLRDKLAKGAGKAPESPDAYKAELDEDLAKIAPDNDPLVQEFRKTSHELNLTNEQFDGIMKMVTGFIGKSQGQTLEDALSNLSEEERAEYEKKQQAAIEEYKKQEYAKIGPNAPRIARAINEWGRQLEAQGHFSEEERKVFNSFGHDANSIKVLNKLRTMMGSGGEIPLDVVDSDSVPSDTEIHRTINSEKYMSGDPETLKKVEGWLNERERLGRPARLQVSV